MRVLLLIAALMAPGLANAEWYIAGDLLQARYQEPQVDGTWRQNALPGANQFTMQSMAWDVGAGYRFDGGESWLSNLWSVEAGYRHYGSGVSSGGAIVSDAAYTEIMNGADPRRYKASTYEVTTHMEGAYLRVAKGFDVGLGVEPYVSCGIEVLYQDTNLWTRNRHGRMGYGGFTGVMAGPTVGGGVKYALWHGVKARVGAESHWMVTESGHPISSQWLTVGGGVEVPLTGWW